MLRCCAVRLHVQSHKHFRIQHPHVGTRFGRQYNRGFIRYGFGGFGMSTYTPRKKRNFRIEPVQDATGGVLARLHRDDGGLSPTTRTLSPNFRTFALDDGGVLVTHPSHAQIMRWGQRVLQAECAATQGGTTMDHYVNSRIQAILANNTIEHTSLSQWRRAHMWRLVKSHAQLQRHWGGGGVTSPSVQGVLSTMNSKGN